MSHQSTGQVLETSCCAKHELLSAWTMVRSRGPSKRPGSGGRVAHANCYLTSNSEVLQLGTSWPNTGPANKSFSSESFSHWLHLNWLLSAPAVHQIFWASSALLCHGLPVSEIQCVLPCFTPRVLAPCFVNCNTQCCHLILNSGDDIKHT